MRLYEKITKAEFSKISMDICNTLYKECSHFIAESRGNILYRGTTDTGIGHIGKLQSHEDRKPRNTPQWLHDYLNDLFVAHLGWKERDGVSTIGHESGHYGTPYLFFPIGDYRFAWSPDVFDIYVALQDIARKTTKTWRQDVDSLDLNDMEVRKHILSLVNSYKDTNLFRAIMKDMEVVFDCKEYYLVNRVYKDDIKRFIKTEWIKRKGYRHEA